MDCRLPKISLLVLAAALSVAGCVSMGRDFTESDVASLHPGEDEKDIVAQLGRPTSMTVGPDGNITEMWIYSHGNAFGNAHARALMLKLGPDRKLIEIMSRSTTNLQMH